MLPWRLPLGDITERKSHARAGCNRVKKGNHSGSTLRVERLEDRRLLAIMVNTLVDEETTPETTPDIQNFALCVLVRQGA